MTAKTHSFNAEVGKVLQLVIHSIYTNRDIFLRELISNASDACDKQRHQQLINNSSAKTEDLEITIKLAPESATLTISDNGIGMNEKELIENLGVIASSGTKRFIEQIENAANLQQIGQFGVGFYSAFMVADKVLVYSTAEGEKTYLWQSDGKDSFSIEESNEKLPRGTKIVLNLKPTEIEYCDKHRVSYIISTYSDHIAFPIHLVDEQGNEEIINQGTALWLRPKGEITHHEYNEFYRHIAHIPEDPWITIHNKVEGNIEYNSLLFVPKNKPFDLFHPDRKGRLKLYVKRVFIADEALQLLPSYLRFIRGVVDCQDLPLNVSRETLQHNSIAQKITKSLAKRILTEVKKKAEENFEEFCEFWNNFGEVLKEGLCESMSEDKELLLDICHFYSTKSDAKITNFDQYISRMLDKQEEIFFLCGDNLENMRCNPQLEGFTKRGIEVLLFKDQVDEFWIHVIHQYKNKPLRSITQGEIDLDKIMHLPTDRNQDSKNQTPTTEDTKNTQSNYAELVDYCTKILGNRIKEVRISQKLINSPACLTIPEGAMSSRMEKLLIEQRQLYNRAAKIFEINPDHQLLKMINSSIDTETRQDLVEIIFGQACLLEGEPIARPHDLANRINRLLTKSC